MRYKEIDRPRQCEGIIAQYDIARSSRGIASYRIKGGKA